MNFSVWRSLCWKKVDVEVIQSYFRIPTVYSPKENKLSKLNCLQLKVFWSNKNWRQLTVTPALDFKELSLTPGRGRGWYFCWKLQGVTDSWASLGHIISWEHWKKRTTVRSCNNPEAQLADSGRCSTYRSKHWCWPGVLDSFLLFLENKHFNLINCVRYFTQHHQAKLGCCLSY